MYRFPAFHEKKHIFYANEHRLGPQVQAPLSDIAGMTYLIDFSKIQKFTETTAFAFREKPLSSFLQIIVWIIWTNIKSSHPISEGHKFIINHYISPLVKGENV